MIPSVSSGAATDPAYRTGASPTAGGNDAVEPARRVKAPANPSDGGDKARSAQEQKQIEELQKIDRAVRAHEQAHLAAAAGLAVSGATYTYRRGPDGKQYAVGGEVSIDASPGRTPSETIGKARRIEAAALAPADPSPQDRAVASRAAQMAIKAQQELTQEKMQESRAPDTRKAETDRSADAAGSADVPARRAEAAIASYQAQGVPASPPGAQIHYTA